MAAGGPLLSDGSSGQQQHEQQQACRTFSMSGIINGSLHDSSRNGSLLAMALVLDEGPRGEYRVARTSIGRIVELIRL